MDKRFITFLLLSFLVVQAYVIIYAPKSDPNKAGQLASSETTATVELVAEGNRTSVSLEQLTTSSDTIREAALVRDVVTGSVTAHPGELTTCTMSKYDLTLDKIGAVINSWEILDTGSNSFGHLQPGNGLELVRRIPQFADNNGMLSVIPGKIGPQTWPLEIGLVEQGSRNYEDFNNLPWTVEQGDKVVRATSPELNGLRVVKEYVFSNDYTINLRVVVENMTTSTVKMYDVHNHGLTLRWGPGLLERTEMARKDETAYDRTSYRMNGKVYKAIPAAGKEPIEAEGPIVWAAMESKFFSAVLIPYRSDDAANQPNFYFRSLIPTNHQVPVKDFPPAMTIELSTARFDLAPQGTQSFDFTIYAGPKKFSILKSADAGAEMQSLMFHDSWSFMRWIYLLLTDVLNWLFNLTHNYGIAIIFLTILVRLIVWPLTQKGMKIQQKSMAEMSRVKPFIDEINEKYKDNPQEKQRRTWEVYKEHNISPFASLRGCMPMLLQLPIFFGLYRVCNDTIDLYGAQFWWIQDLSQPDRLMHLGFTIPILGSYLNILPITMAITQFLATWISMKRSKNMDPTQRNMMYVMPLMFVFILYSLPAGLMIYWNVSNIWQIFQTMIINRIIEREEKEEALKPKSAVMPAKKTQSAGNGKFTKGGKPQQQGKPGFWDNFRKALEQRMAEAEKMRAEAEKRKKNKK